VKPSCHCEGTAIIEKLVADDDFEVFAGIDSKEIEILAGSCPSA
jgi:hypothetical protein